MSDVAVVLCPNCMQKYRVPEKMIGRRAVCKQCGERFKVSRPAELDEDTVVGWVSAEDPTGTSVMGSSSIFSAPTGDESAARRRWRRPPPPAEPRIHFVRVDRHGAWFEFEAVMLELPALRGSFPHRCVHCLNPKYLNLHYVL